MSHYEENYGDGFSNTPDATNNMIRGTIIKCVDGFWTYGESRTALMAGTSHVALDMADALVRWDDKVKTTVPREPGKPMPKPPWGANDTVIGLDGEPQPAWQQERYLYTMDPTDASLFTYVAGAASAIGVIGQLADQICRMRQLRRDPRLLALFEYGSAPMKTKFGLKRKPALLIKGWLGGNTPLVGGNNTPPQLGHNDNGPSLVEKVQKKIDAITRRDRDDMNDDNPY
jgi:hypothetical protein